MIHDIGFLQSRMSKLEGSGELSQYLLQVVNEKSVAQEMEKKEEGAELKSIPDTPSANGQSVENHSDEKT